ncbi:MAG: LiaF-related protein [bacterium]|nr:LiaF-related protein [bacterium]
MGTRVRVYRGRSNRGCIVLLVLGFVLICIAPCAITGGLIFAASRGAFGEAEVLDASYNEPKGDAQSAQVSILAGLADMDVTAFVDSSELFAADIRYVGGIDYNVSGEEEKRVSLRQTQGDFDFFGALSLFNININPTDEQLRWTVSLTPDLPLSLDIEGGVADMTLDLSTLELQDVRLETGVGNTTVTLPAPAEGIGSYEVRLNGGVGDANITLPEGVEVRIEADRGVGDVNVPSGLERISGSDTAGPDTRGVWETAGYDDAEVRITIIVDGGVGDLTVR